jgi:hypothetical protein
MTPCSIYLQYVDHEFGRIAAGILAQHNFELALQQQGLPQLPRLVSGCGGLPAGWFDCLFEGDGTGVRGFLACPPRMETALVSHCITLFFTHSSSFSDPGNC